jgi:hypothetical protein
MLASFLVALIPCTLQDEADDRFVLQVKAGYFTTDPGADDRVPANDQGSGPGV